MSKFFLIIPFTIIGFRRKNYVFLILFTTPVTISKTNCNMALHLCQKIKFIVTELADFVQDFKE